MRWLVLLFIVLPAAELMLLLKIGARIGAMPTFALIVVTGIVGASLARQQGLSVIHRLQTDLGQGRVPAGPLADGVIILVAGALLVTPGVITDVVGFLCLIPACRALARALAMRWFRSAVKRGTVHTHSHVRVDWPGDFQRGGPGSDGWPGGAPGGQGPVIDVVPERLEAPEPESDSDGAAPRGKE